MQPTSQKSPPQISPEQTCGQEDSRVRIFRSLAASEGLTEQEVDSFLHLLNSSKAKVLKIDPHGLSLKMLRISYPFMEDGTLRPFSIRWPHSAMVLRGVTSEGKILVADPASKKRSEQEWDISIILDEARKGAAAGGPLWAIY